MSKSKKMKFKDFLCKPLIVWVLIQIAIVFLFMWGYTQDTSITLQDCYSDSIIVEEKHFIKGYRRIRSSAFYVVSGGESYSFPATKYKEIELDKMISIGEVIEIHYINSNSGNHFLIVDARNENEVYVDINEYNRESQLSNVFMIITFSIVEILYLALTKFFGIFDDIASFYKALKKKQDKLKKKNSKSQSNN